MRNLRIAPVLILVALLLALSACGGVGGRVEQVDSSFVERDAAGFATPGRDSRDVRVQEIPGWGVGSKGAFSGNATGVAAIMEKDGRRTLVLQGFTSPQGELYLTRGGDVDGAIRLGSTGSASYTVPGIAGIEGYDRVIVVSDGSVVAAAGMS